MAEPTTPPTTPPAPKPLAGSDDAFTKMFIRLGMATSATFEEDVKRPLTKLEASIQKFHNSTQYKDSFFSKLSSDGRLLDKLIPDVARFTVSLITLGQASRDSADQKQLYESMGMFGKLLVNMTPSIADAEKGTWGLGSAIQKVFTTGILLAITLVVTALAFAGQALKDVALAGIKFQDELNKLNTIMGGVSRDRLSAFNIRLNETFKGLTSLGVGVGTVLEAMAGFIKGGLNPAIAFQGDLIRTSTMLAKITGESSEAMANFFATIMVGSKISSENLKSLGDSFTRMNRVAEASGVLASVSFGDVQEAITSVGTALLIASNKGSVFTDKMTHDLVSLTTLAKTLGVSVAELNSKFEESSNLLTSPDSGFRALLAISGGATISEMLSNSFNKTDAMLRISGTLERLNIALHGNLNLMGQVAQAQFGISKQDAIKWATMTQQQKDAIRQAKADAEKMKNDGITDAYNSVTGTLTETWEKFKNVMFMSFQRAVAGNQGLQGFLGKIADKLNEWIAGFGDPNSPAQKFIDRLSEGMTWISEMLEKLFDRLVPILESLGNWFNSILTTAMDVGVGTALGDILGDILVKSLSFAWKATIGNPKFWIPLIGAVIGGIIGFISPLPGGAALGAMLGGGLFAGMMGAVPEEEKKQETANERRQSIAGLSGSISELLKSTDKDQKKYSNLKDTDMVMGRDGNLTLAGLEKIKLEEKEEALLKVQKNLADNTKDLTTAMMEATAAIKQWGGKVDENAVKSQVAGIKAKEAERTNSLQENIEDNPTVMMGS